MKALQHSFDPSSYKLKNTKYVPDNEKPNVRPPETYCMNFLQSCE
jgi:hypothetical protein